jgi:hypothetical protein
MITIEVTAPHAVPVPTMKKHDLYDPHRKAATEELPTAPETARADAVY